LSKKIEWYDSFPSSNIFANITPSLWAFIAGANYSIVVELITTLRFQGELTLGISLALALFFSSGSVFIRLSMKVEEFQKEIDTLAAIRDEKLHLTTLLLVGIISTIVALFTIWF